MAAAWGDAWWADKLLPGPSGGLLAELCLADPEIVEVRTEAELQALTARMGVRGATKSLYPLYLQQAQKLRREAEKLCRGTAG